MKLKGRVALVTGASRGIGAGIARCMAGEGATVVVNYLRAEAAARQVVRHYLTGPRSYTTYGSRSDTTAR